MVSAIAAAAAAARAGERREVEVAVRGRQRTTDCLSWKTRRPILRVTAIVARHTKPVRDFFGQQQQQQQQQKVDHPTTTSNNSPSKRDVLVIQIGKRKKESQHATATNSKKQKSDVAQNSKADFRCTTISRNNGSDGESDSKTKKEKRSVKLKISKTNRVQS